METNGETEIGDVNLLSGDDMKLHQTLTRRFKQYGRLSFS